ncbi:MAG TPA: hypothetical protein DDW20_03535 [Firmicutes bacterium]|nr:hypothetical protein [Bacillota bacterium]
MKNFNIENVMNGNASVEEVKALLAQIIEKNENVIRKEVAMSIEAQMRAEITDSVKELYGEDRVVECDDKKFVLIDTGKKNHYEWLITVEEIKKEDVKKYSEVTRCAYNGGNYKNLPTKILKEKVFRDVPYGHYVYSVPPQYDGATKSNNEMFRTLIESDLIENLEVINRDCYSKDLDDLIYVEVSFDLPLLIKNEVTALRASNYIEWIEKLQYRKNNYMNRLSRSSVKDFVLDAVFEQEE